MFSEPRVNVIQSDEGFSVEVLGRTGLLYSEGDRHLRVNSELLVGPPWIAIWADSIKRWDAPEDAPIIDRAKQDGILDNIRRAFRFRGYEIDVVDAR